MIIEHICPSEAEGLKQELWKLSMLLIEQRDVGNIEVESITPKAARGLLKERTGASKTIDKARENSLLLKYQLYRLMVDMTRGNAVRELFKDVNRDKMEQVKQWSKSAWSAVSTENIPDIW